MTKIGTFASLEASNMVTAMVYDSYFFEVDTQAQI